MNIGHFIEARITEDENAANGLIQRPGNYRHITHINDVVGTTRPECPDCQAMLYWPGPRRALKECAAKRAIIAAHSDSSAWCDHCAGPGEPSIYCPTIRALANIYADHPDYDPEWSDQ